jgi:membrane protein required for colicin V production
MAKMHFTQWTFLDFIFAGIILISILFALRKGLTREIASLIALIGGFFLAALYYPVAAKKLTYFSRTETIANLLGFMAIFVGCILIGAVISFLINRFMKKASLQWFDRVLGGVFGLIRGWAIASILVIGIIAFPINLNLMARSVLAPYLLAGARAGVSMVPQSLKNQFDQQYRKVREIWNQNRSADGSRN